MFVDMGKIKKALIEFPWDDYGLDNVTVLARDEPDADVFEDVAHAIVQEHEG